MLQNIMNPAPSPSTELLYSTLPGATQLHGSYLPRAAIKRTLTCSLSVLYVKELSIFNSQAPKCTFT